MVPPISGALSDGVGVEVGGGAGPEWGRVGDEVEDEDEDEAEAEAETEAEEENSVEEEGDACFLVVVDALDRELDEVLELLELLELLGLLEAPPDVPTIPSPTGTAS